MSLNILSESRNDDAGKGWKNAMVADMVSVDFCLCCS